MNLAPKREEIIKKLKKYFSNRGDVAAAYLFGSLAMNEPVANDVDILVLAARDANPDDVWFSILADLCKILSLPEEKIDVIPFSLDEIQIEIIYDAVENGVLLVEKDEDYLGDMLEALSSRMKETEIIRARRLQLILEEYSAPSNKNSDQ